MEINLQVRKVEPFRQVKELEPFTISLERANSPPSKDTK